MTNNILKGTAFLVGTFCFGDTTAQTSNKPDVLFIFTDDQTFDGLNSLGNSDLITPNFDALVKSGTSFSNSYIMGGWHGAISVASRSQMITGRYVWNSYEDEKNKYTSNISTETMWPQVMGNAGYKTFLTGKWHLKTDANKLFDETNTVRGGMPGQTPVGYKRPVEGQVDKWSAWDRKHGGFWSDKNGKHWSENQADIAIDFIKTNKESEKPLFMYVAFNAPHDPRQSPKEYMDMYDADTLKVPASYMTMHPLMKELGMYDFHHNKDGIMRDEDLAPLPRTEYAVKRNLQEYYAIISHLDVQVGRLIDELKKSGRYENTIIVFGADNGLGMGKHGLIGKQNLYDHSVKVPLVFAGPNIPKGKTRNQLVYLQDLVPTIYEMVGIDAPVGMQFQSQAAAVKSKRAKGRTSVYATYMNNQRMVRKGDYKLFFIPLAKKVYLFNLKKDPNELNNLSDNPKYDKLIKELAADYLVLAKESGDTFDLASVYPSVFGK